MPIPELREVLFPPEVAEKLWNKHLLSQRQVEEVIFAPISKPRWDVDEAHGGRIVIKGQTVEAKPRDVFVALRPVDIDSGVWACITAFCLSDPGYGEEE